MSIFFPFIIPFHVVETFIPDDRSYILYKFRLLDNYSYMSDTCYSHILEFDVCVSPVSPIILSDIKCPNVECFIDLCNNNITLTKNRIIIKNFSVFNIKYSSKNILSFYGKIFNNYEKEMYFEGCKFSMIDDLLAKKKKIKNIISILLKYKKQQKKGFISLVKTSFSAILLGYFNIIYKW